MNGGILTTTEIIPAPEYSIFQNKITLPHFPVVTNLFISEAKFFRFAFLCLFDAPATICYSQSVFAQGYAGAVSGRWVDHSN